MRPEGMKENPYTYERCASTCEVCDAEDACQVAFEAGADAYEEAIWKMAKESPTGTFTFDTHEVNIQSLSQRRSNA